MSAPMRTSLQTERVVAGAPTARWKPAEIAVERGRRTRSTLKFSLGLQTYDLEQSCTGNTEIGYVMKGGSIGGGFEYDTWAFTDSGSESGACTVTAKFQGSPVRAKLSVAVR